MSDSNDLVIQDDDSRKPWQFQKGNRFWERRSRHGVPKLFESPQLMWEAACEYFEHQLNSPWIKYEKPAKIYVEFTKDEEGDVDTAQAEAARQVREQLIGIPTTPPFTLHGLCIYLGCSSSYFRNFKNQERKDGDDFSSVISRIEDVIYNQKFEGAAVGAYNANIIARDLGLKDGQDIGVGGIGGGPVRHQLTITHVQALVPIANSEEEIQEF